MRDTLEIEGLLQALDNYTDAAHKENEARNRFEGESWGYFGRHFIEAKESAAEDIQKRLNEYIDKRIAAALKP